MATYSDVANIAALQVPAGTFTTVESEPPFAQLVREANFLLKENNPVSYDSIRKVTPSVYYRMYLRIASARNEDNTFLYTADEVLAMIEPAGGSSGTDRYDIYGGGTEWVASKLVAAHLIRTIPLNTSSIKQVDVSDNLEKQALEDLDYIIRLTDGGGTAATTDDDVQEGQITLYLSHDLNKATIPEAAFSLPDAGSSPPTYNNPVDLGKSVEVVDGVTVPVGSTSFCYFYMTGQAYNADKDAILSTTQNENSSSVTYKIEDVFEVPDGTNIDYLIMMIADAINSKTLEQIDPMYVGNILVAPERGVDTIRRTTTRKKLCYPASVNLRSREAIFELCFRVNKLGFDTRRYSTKSDTELLTIAFYTTDTINWTSYQSNPTTAALGTLRSASTLGIEGLIYGQHEEYGSMANGSPISVLLNVEKGNVIPVSIQDGGGSEADLQDQYGDPADLAKTDTFYFYAEDTFTGFTQNLVLRVSSNDYQASSPLIIEVDLSNISVAPGAPPNCVGEEVARRVTDAIYQYTRTAHTNEDTNDNSNVLAVLLGEYNYNYLNVNLTDNSVTEIDLRPDNPDTVEVEYERDRDAGRVQMVGFRYKENEFRIIVEIISLPPELWIATGNYVVRRTLWVKGKPRSVCAETKVLNTGSQVAETDSETLASVNASVSTAEASISSILQRVYDKKRLMKDSLKGYPKKWQQTN